MGDAQAYAVENQQEAVTVQPRRSGVGTVLGEELFRVALFAVFLVQVGGRPNKGFWVGELGLGAFGRCLLQGPSSVAPWQTLINFAL